MDHDAMNRHVQGLLKFRAAAEEAINFYLILKAAGGSMPVPASGVPAIAAPALTDAQLDQLDASLKAHLDDGIAKITARQDDFEKRLADIEVKMGGSSDVADRLAAIEKRVGDVEVDLDQIASSLDPGESSTGSEPANAEAGNASGAVSAGAGTDAGGNAAPPVAAPVVTEANQDPGKEPAPVVDGIDSQAGTGPGTGGPGSPAA